MRGEEGSRKIKGWMTVLLLTAAVWGGMLGSFCTGNLTVYGFSFSGELFSDAMDIDPEWAFDHNSQISAAAPEDSLDKAIEQLGIFGEMEELQHFLDRVLGDIKDSGERISFWGIMKEFIRGDLAGALSQIGQALYGILFSEVKTGSRMLYQTVALGLAGAIFANLSSVFKGGQVSDTGFFVTYLLMFTCLAASFSSSLRIASEALGQILEFMRLLMPAYYMAVAFSGGSMSALALHECMLGAVTGVQWMCHSFLLPLTRVYVMTVLGSLAVKEDPLSRLSGLIEQAVTWSFKTLIGVVVGFHMIQGLVLPYADGAGSAGFKRLLELIPGLGQGAGAVAQMVLGSGVLIKNTMGAAAVVVLALITAAPVLKLAVLMVFYQLAAAVMEPVCAKQAVKAVEGAAKGHRLLIRLVLGSMFLFIVCIAITCSFTNVNYFAS